MKRAKRGVVFVLILCMMFSSFFAGFTLRSVFAQEDKLSDFELFWEVIELVEKEFVNPVENFTPLIHGAIRGMLSSLGNDYTRFMDPRAYREMQVETKGEFGGVGIQIGIKNKKLIVIAPLPDTPAERAGLKAGDWIQKINGRSTKDMAVEEAVTLIRGQRGTEVTLTILHPGEKKPVDYLLVRDIIKIKSVEKEIMDKDIGYAKIVIFNEKTVEELESVFQEFKDKEIRGLIIDLRYNPGGLLTSAIQVADKFLSSGPIVQVEHRKKKKKVIEAQRGTSAPRVPCVVLVNEYSASASEIVAGALQDNKIATLVGTKTFGKGSVQTVHKLRDNSAVVITTAKYLTSKGRDIDGKKGIMPDIVVEKPKKEKEDKEEEEKEKEVDVQLEKAKEVLRGKIIK
ncbi:MAG: Carboxy-terminal processing protease CtpA [candidate division WS2 bacterium]|nr:Carboxy-terminal processing protease CtpA [Candidatus Lithacetigena glycinireducens]